MKRSQRLCWSGRINNTGDVDGPQPVNANKSNKLGEVLTNDRTPIGVLGARARETSCLGHRDNTG